MSNLSKIKLPNNDIVNIKDSDAIHIDDMTTINLSGYDVDDIIPQSIIDRIQDWSVLKYNNDFYSLQSKTATTFVFASAMTSSLSIQGKRLVITKNTDNETYYLSNLNIIDGSNTESWGYYKVDINDTELVSEFKTLVEGHIANNEHYLYDLSDFCDGADCCEVDFIQTAWGGKYLNIFSVNKGMYYTDYLGYEYYDREGYTLEDYFVEMCIQTTPRILKVNNINITFAYILASITLMDNLGDYILFDLHALTDRPSLFCTVSFDTANNKAFLLDIMNMKYAEVTYDNTTKVSDIIPYVETPIKVFAGEPRDGEYVGELSIVKNWNWKQITNQDDMVVGSRYRISLPAGIPVFPTSIEGQYIEMNNYTIVQTSLSPTTYVYGEEWEDTAHVGYFVTDTKAFMASSINRETHTATGYDVTTTTGTTPFVVEADYVSSHHNVSSFFISCTSVQATNYSATKMWNGLIWTELSTMSDISKVYEVLGKIVDLTEYKQGDIVPTNLVEDLIAHNHKIEYDTELESGRVLNLVMDLAEYHQGNDTDDIPYILYQCPYADDWNEISYQIVVLAKDVIHEGGASAPWKLTRVASLGALTYQEDGSVTVWMGPTNNDIQFTNWDESATVTLAINADQTTDNTIYFPSGNGTLALTSQIPNVQSMIDTSLASYTTTTDQQAIDSAQNTQIALKANSSDLHAVATSGSYDDLLNKPTIPSIAGLATETYVDTAESDANAYTDQKIAALPSIPSNVSAFTNDAGYLTQHQDISGKADVLTTYNKTEVNNLLSDKVDKVTGSSLMTTAEHNKLSTLENYELTSSKIVTALGYTPYSNANPNHYITGITSSDVTTALGYTPYNSTNPNGYITNAAHNLTYYYDKTYIDGLVDLGFEAIIVPAKPADPVQGKIYLVPITGQQDAYDEWMWILEEGGYTWKKIGTTSIDMSEYAKISDLNNVAFTGAYSALVGKPTIPASTSDLTNDSGFITNTVNNLTNYTPTSGLATVATTGAYSDLTGRPTIPTQTSQLTNNSGFVTNNDLSQVNVSTFINDGDGDYRYATLEDIQVLEHLDPAEIQHAIEIAEHVGSVDWVEGGTGLTGSGSQSITINHANSIAANTSFPQGTTLVNGGSFTVRDVEYDSTGHVTNYQDRVINMTAIPPYDDTAVYQAITDVANDLNDLSGEVEEHFEHLIPSVKFYVLSFLGNEPYINPNTLEPVTGRYYQLSDITTADVIDNNKLDIAIKAWIQHLIGFNTPELLEKASVYIIYQSNGNYVNNFCNFWTIKTNTSISTYPSLCQTGAYSDDGYGSTPAMTATMPGVVAPLQTDGYIYSMDNNGHASVYGWGALKGRVDDLEDTIGDINSALDAINRTVI